MDTLLTAAMQMNADVEAMTSDSVKLWMNWMFLVFVASILFVWRHSTARWTLATLVVGILLALLTYHLTENIHLLGATHFILWLPLLVLIWKRDFKNTTFTIKSPYGTWLVLLAVTICISLIFDARDLILVAMDMK